MNKLLPKTQRKKVSNGILLRHKIYLKELENKKNEEREEAKRLLDEEDIRLLIIKENAEK